MLEFLGQCKQHRTSDRKLRLFACSCCRRVWHLLEDERSHRAVEAGEQLADELINLEDVGVIIVQAERALNRLRRRFGAASPQAGAARAAQALGREARRAAEHAANHARWAEDWETIYESKPLDDVQSRQCTLLRDIVGNPFSPVAVDPAWLLWNNQVIPKLAQTAYEERPTADGLLDSVRLAVLADALEEAGCTGGDILGHLRGLGPHVRGCFVIDLLMGKEGAE
jgi:hypothetical protein